MPALQSSQARVGRIVVAHKVRQVLKCCMARVHLVLVWWERGLYRAAFNASPPPPGEPVAMPNCCH